MENTKKIFQFSKPYWKKAWNKIDYQTRGVVGMVILLLFGTRTLIRDGLENGKVLEIKEDWIKNTVRNPKSEGFDYLDEEEPPVSLPRRTALDQFRSEFAKIRSSYEHPYK